MPFAAKEALGTTRRSFQINIGLVEGYGTNIKHTSQEVLDLIGEWMKMRMEAKQPVITGGMLVPGTMVYAWNSEQTGIKVNQEDTVLFIGEINPLYSSDLTDFGAVIVLQDLASFIGDRLNQTRMYVMYQDKMFILQNDKMTHPTEKRTVVLTPAGEQEADWRRVVELKPEGYLELNNGKDIIHGPIESVIMNERDHVVITLKWAATTPALEQPGFGEWENLPDDKSRVITIPNLVIPFVIKDTPSKGPRVMFGNNILYINKVNGLDPKKVKGLKID